MPTATQLPPGRVEVGIGISVALCWGLCCICTDWNKGNDQLYLSLSPVRLPRPCLRAGGKAQLETTWPDWVQLPPTPGALNTLEKILHRNSQCEVLTFPLFR